MNAYEQRRKAIADKQNATRKANQEVRMMEVDALMKRYENVYFDYYGRNCKVKYAKGWFTVHHRKVREERFLLMIKQLEVLLHQQEQVDDL